MIFERYVRDWFNIVLHLNTNDISIENERDFSLAGFVKRYSNQWRRLMFKHGLNIFYFSLCVLKWNIIYRTQWRPINWTWTSNNIWESKKGKPIAFPLIIYEEGTDNYVAIHYKCWYWWTLFIESFNSVWIKWKKLFEIFFYWTSKRGAPTIETSHNKCMRRMRTILNKRISQHYSFQWKICLIADKNVYCANHSRQL